MLSVKSFFNMIHNSLKSRLFVTQELFAAADQSHSLCISSTDTINYTDGSVNALSVQYLQQWKITTDISRLKRHSSAKKWAVSHPLPWDFSCHDDRGVASGKK